MRSKRSFIWLVVVALMLGMVSAFAQKQKKRPVRKAKTQDSRVYLVHADLLHFDERENPNATILNGKVHFTHQGARLYCDSAYFYEVSNSFEAFGHVKMYQGDTLSLFSDYAFYDGNEQLARARYNVVLTHKKTKLLTDSLDFDRIYNNAYFFEGGKMIDGETTLTSDWGEYNTESKMSVFNYDVKMQSPKFFLTTDTLYYDTRISMAHIVGPSNITSGESHIYSEQGYYDTKNDIARLMNRSVLRNGGKMMVGDSVYYDSKQGMSQAFRNVVYVDSLNRNKLTGNYGEYYDYTGYAMCTDSAVAIDFSQGDSLFMHADTFKIVTFNIDTDSMYRKIHAYHHVRAYRRDVQGDCDSQLLSDTTCYNQVSSKEMFAFFVDGDIREARAKDNVLIGYYFEEGDSVPIIYNYQQTSELRMFMKNKQLESVWTPKTSGTMYPLNQIPEDRKHLPGFMWYDYIRPLNRYDIFNWRPKK